MGILKKIGIALLVFVLLLAALIFWLTRGDTAELSVAQVTGTDPVLAEPEAESFPTVNIAKPVGWPDDAVPDAAEGLQVARFAAGLDHPRVLYTLPNGDVLVTLTGAPPSGDGGGGIRGFIAGILFARAGAGGDPANQLVLLRDANEDGVAEARTVLREDDLSSPSGIAWQDGTLYIANHNALLAFDYELGSTKVTGEPRKLMDLPGGGGHWMRNIILSPDGSRIYVAVGSVSNIGDEGMEVEQGRAAIWEYNLETNSARRFAEGLRNPNGLDWNPWSGELWTTVNERDMLGSDLVPDYLTDVPVGAQYGWPWIYWGDNFDRRVEIPQPRYLTEYTRRPAYALGPHVAALGLAFSRGGNTLGSAFGSGAFIARHGSWNRKPASGYDVVFVPFDGNGNPTGKPQPVLTGFLTGDGETRGRPTWVAFDQTGALLVSDDTAGIIWRVSAPGATPLPPIRQVEVDRLPSRAVGENPEASFTEDFAREVNAN